MLTRLFLLLLLTCCVAWAGEEIDKTAPGRLAGMVRRADYCARVSGTLDNPREKKLSDPQAVEAIARILSEATYHPTLHGFSVSRHLFVFYAKGKVSMAVSVQPGHILRFQNAHAEENMVVDDSTIDALTKVYESTGP